MHVRIIRGKFVTADWTASLDDSSSGRERASSLSRHSRPFSPFYFFYLFFLFSSFPPTRNFRATHQPVDIHSPFFARRPKGKIDSAKVVEVFPSRIPFVRKSLNGNSRIHVSADWPKKFIFPPPVDRRRIKFSPHEGKNGDEFFNRKFGGEKGGEIRGIFECALEKWNPRGRLKIVNR